MLVGVVWWCGVVWCGVGFYFMFYIKYFIVSGFGKIF